MTSAERSLVTIRDLFHQLQRLPCSQRPDTGGHGNRNRVPSREYTSLLLQIRAAVDARKLIVTGELVLIATVTQFGPELGRKGKTAA